MSQLLQFDTLDDRREVHRLLTIMPPQKRLAFLRWCCARCSVLGSATRPGPARRMLPRIAEAERSDDAAERLALEMYYDFWALVSQYGLDADAATRQLERMAREA